MRWALSNLTALSALGGVVVFIWSVWQVLSQRRREAAERQFQTYHNLVKWLVEGESSQAGLYTDRQATVVFELRNFPRYYEYTQRMLEHLKKAWRDKPNQARLVEEIDLTLDHIRRKG